LTLVLYNGHVRLKPCDLVWNGVNCDCKK